MMRRRENVSASQELLAETAIAAKMVTGSSAPLAATVSVVCYRIFLFDYLPFIIQSFYEMMRVCKQEILGCLEF